MKNNFKVIILALILVVLSVFVIACSSGEDYTSIATPNLKYENGTYIVNLSSTNTKIDITSYFSISEKASFIISKDESFSDIDEDGIVDLKDGENIFYVKVNDKNKNESIYKFSFIRKKTLEVIFKVNDEEISKIQCEEGELIQAPESTKQGYSITWEYDFKTPVTSNTTIVGSLVPNEYEITISAEGTSVDGTKVTAKFGEVPDISVPQKPGYKFTGWTYNNTTFDAISAYKIAKSITIVADFSIETYSINYHLYGGNNNGENKLLYDATFETFELLSPAWVDDTYTFGGWFLDADYTMPVTKIEQGTTGDLELHAKWNHVEYKTTVTLVAPGLSFDGESIVLTYGETYDLSGYSKSGYTLELWNSTLGIIQNTGVWNIKADELTIEPQWKPIAYSITYNGLNGGDNSLNPSTYTIEDAFTLAPLTWVDGTFTFIGWYLDSTFTESITGIEKGTAEPLVLYAKCEVVIQQKTTNVTIKAPDYDCDGEVISINHGEEYNLPEIAENGYVFLGWMSEDGTKLFDVTGTWSDESEELVLVPNFKIEKYTIGYELNGGVNSTNNPTEYTMLEGVTLAAPIWLDNSYEFEGWFLDKNFETKFVDFEAGRTGSFTVYAKWTKITNIIISAPGYDCNNQNIKFTFGDEYSLPDITKTGYILSGWNTEDGAIVVPNSGKWLREEASLTLVPVWQLQTYTITYMLNGGTNNESNKVTFTIEDVIDLLEPTKQYATFDGWYTEETFENKLEQISSLASNITLYAKWKVETYTVTLDSVGGNVTSNSVTVIYGENYIIPTPTKPGYNFDGWYNEDTLFENLEGQWLTQNNVTLVAKWSLATYTIEYELNDGIFISQNYKKQYTINDANFVLPTPVKENYIFLGWTTDDGIIRKTVTISKGSYGNRKYTANWCDVKDSNGFMYNISNDGTASIVGYDGKVGSMTIPSEYNGHTVTSIDNNAFNGYGEKIANLSGSDNNGFVTLYIPETITRIGKDAFANCNDLKIQLAGANDTKIEQWVSKIVIESGNAQVIDVIRNVRPAIGWYPYKKP